MKSQTDPKVIIALDFDKESKALALVEKLSPKHCRLKVGKEMFTYFGPALVKELVRRDFDVFLDLKFHDIPNTVAKACVAAADLGVWMLNVHASGGVRMMETARIALEQAESNRPKLIAVTVLTSMDQNQLANIGIEQAPQEQVLRLAKLTQVSGLDGVVCSAQESRLLRSELNGDFALVTPGIRPAGTDAGDQKRIMTPQQAMQAGVDYIVVGRPITQALDPTSALAEINQSIGYIPA